MQTKSVEHDNGCLFEAVILENSDDISKVLRLAKEKDWDEGNDRDTFYGEPVADCIRKSRLGDTALVKAAEKLVGDFEVADMQVKKRKRVMSPVGGFVDIGAAYMGVPDCCVRHANVLADDAPITVVLDIGVRANVRNSSILRRGAALLSLVRQVSAVRPIDLYLTYGGYCYGYKAGVMLYKLDTNPLDVARAAWFLCTAAMQRRVAWSAIKAATGTPSSNWMGLLDRYSQRNIRTAVCDVLGVDVENTLYIGRESLAQQFDSDESAKAWVQGKVKEYLSER